MMNHTASCEVLLEEFGPQPADLPGDAEHLRLAIDLITEMTFNRQ